MSILGCFCPCHFTGHAVVGYCGSSLHISNVPLDLFRMTSSDRPHLVAYLHPIWNYQWSKQHVHVLYNLHRHVHTQLVFVSAAASLSKRPTPSTWPRCVLKVIVSLPLSKNSKSVPMLLQSSYLEGNLFAFQICWAWTGIISQ